MPLTYPVADAVVNGSLASVPLTVGTFQPGDVRLVFTSSPTNRSWSTVPTGWTKVLDQLIASSGRVALFAKELVTGDTDQSCSYVEGAAGLGYARLTVRGAVPGQIPGGLQAIQAGSSTASTSNVAANLAAAPPVPGDLITFHATTATAGGNLATFTDPASPWTRRAFSPSDAAGGYVLDCGSELRTATGTPGTRTAVCSVSGTWRAISLFLQSIQRPGQHFSCFT